MKDRVRVCELCSGEANVYCSSDAAFLCFTCDSNVHNANFLVARHLRRLICSQCKSLAGNPFSGTRSPRILTMLCDSCLPDKEMDSISRSASSTLSSACISSTGDSQTSVAKTVSSIEMEKVSGVKRNIPVRLSVERPTIFMNRRSRAPPVTEERTKEIFENWCNKLGLKSNLVVLKATGAMRKLNGRLSRVLPFQVSAAASFWFGLRFIGNATRQNLRTLESVSGVPAKLIVAVELKLEQALRVTASARPDMEEGWAECSV